MDRMKFYNCLPESHAEVLPLRTGRGEPPRRASHETCAWEVHLRAQCL